MKTGSTGSPRCSGTYTLTASGTGFANSTLGSVELTVNRTLTFDVQLEVGKVQEQVNVTAETQLIDSTSSATGTIVTHAKSRNIPSTVATTSTCCSSFPESPSTGNPATIMRIRY